MECPSEFVPSNPRTTTVGPRGCNVDFLTVDEVCVIATPGFPSNYRDDACKEWSIRPASDGVPITISFDQFDVSFAFVTIVCLGNLVIWLIKMHKVDSKVQYVQYLGFLFVYSLYLAA